MANAPAPAPFTPAVVPDVGTPPQAVMPKPATPQKKEIPSTPNKVIGARVSIQYRGEDGKVYEATTTISADEYKVQSHSLAVEEKHEKKYVKNSDGTKDILGFEDTGERILTFKMRYHVR